MTKYYWPTWADWLEAYGHPVRNWAYVGYGNNHQEWILYDGCDQITPNDHVIIMWPQNHRIMQWYDREWIEQLDCEGFFPHTQGRLWFTQDTPWLGLYRTHPDHPFSLTQMIVHGFLTILNVQRFLKHIGCKVTMTFAQNPWIDGRPIYSPAFKTRWQSLEQVSSTEIEHAKRLWKLKPFRAMMEQIDWSCFIDPPNDLENIMQYKGIWEYYLNDKEYVVLKHDTDNHPVSLTHHDWALEKILKQDARNGRFRDLAQQISLSAAHMVVPDFTDLDAVASCSKIMLDQHFGDLLNERCRKTIL